MLQKLRIERLRFPRESLVALAFSTIKSVLELGGKPELFPFVQSVSIQGDRVDVVTHKPIANAELSLFRTAFESEFRLRASRFGILTEFRFQLR